MVPAHTCWHRSNISSLRIFYIDTFLYIFGPVHSYMKTLYLAVYCVLYNSCAKLDSELYENQHCFYYLTDLRYILKVIFVKKNEKEKKCIHTFPYIRARMACDTVTTFSCNTTCIVHWSIIEVNMSVYKWMLFFSCNN